MAPVWKRLLFPPGWLLTLLTLLSAGGLSLVFLRDMAEHPAAVPVYALAFYTLCALCAWALCVLPDRYRQLRERIRAHPVGSRYLTDPAFRTRVALYRSLAANLFYGALNLLSWYLYHSWWFVVLAVYYCILAVMRFLLVRYVHVQGIGKNRLGELRRARLCAGILLLINLVLSGAVLMILYRDKGHRYPGVLIYVMAAYAFYITIHGITDLIQYRKYRSPVMTVSKIIALSAALVSMLNLETAMFARFGADMAPGDRRLMIMLTGAGVSITVVTLSVGIMIRTGKEIKEIKQHG